jgi:hypothetical protein
MSVIFICAEEKLLRCYLCLVPEEIFDLLEKLLRDTTTAATCRSCPEKLGNSLRLVEACMQDYLLIELCVIIN